MYWLIEWEVWFQGNFIQRLKGHRWALSFSFRLCLLLLFFSTSDRFSAHNRGDNHQQSLIHIYLPLDQEASVQTISVIDPYCHWPVRMVGGSEYLISSLSKITLEWGRSSSLKK